MRTSMRTLILVITALAALWTAPAYSRELERLNVDLDGDGRPDAVTISINGKGDFHKFKIQIGTSEYSSEFFAVFGDVPQIEIISIDRDRKLRQLLVTTYGASYCDYHLLSYVHGKLKLLIKTSSEGCDEVPLPRGN